MRSLAAFSFVLSVLCLGCGEEDLPPVPAPDPDAEARLDDAVAKSSCGAVHDVFEIEGAAHVPNCSPVTYGTNPPSSGTHYGTWAAFRNYDTPLPRGFWVHSLEHGAVVISYSCSDCDAEIDAARAVIDEAGVDPLCCTETSCGSPVSRVILTPDPELDVPWAASSWGHTLRVDCFEPKVFAAFIDARRGHGAEGVCSDGADLSGFECPPP
ncbi:MAG TPA: DUF3105 domain-containing protein [Polyangiaceae bacterium]